jgi:hypothetical protein
MLQFFLLEVFEILVMQLAKGRERGDGASWMQDGMDGNDRLGRVLSVRRRVEHLVLRGSGSELAAG